MLLAPRKVDAPEGTRDFRGRFAVTRTAQAVVALMRDALGEAYVTCCLHFTSCGKTNLIRTLLGTVGVRLAL